MPIHFQFTNRLENSIFCLSFFGFASTILFFDYSCSNQSFFINELMFSIKCFQFSYSHIVGLRNNVVYVVLSISANNYIDFYNNYYHFVEFISP